MRASWFSSAKRLLGAGFLLSWLTLLLLCAFASACMCPRAQPQKDDKVLSFLFVCVRACVLLSLLQQVSCCFSPKLSI